MTKRLDEGQKHQKQEDTPGIESDSKCWANGLTVIQRNKAIIRGG